MADYIKPVIFRLGNQQFGVDINLVQSIEREINILIVPNAMKYISGVVKLALEVDEVLEIGDIDAQSIVQMPALAKTVDTEYLDRVANVNGQLVILLDVEKLLTQSEAESVKKFTEDMNDNDGGAANV